MKNKKLVLFDLDGVIINSKSNMEYAWKSVQDTFDISTPFTDYFKNIGRPFLEIMEKLGYSENGKEIEWVYKSTSLKKLDEIEFYDGVSNVLKDLFENDYKLGIVTSKDKERTNIILEKLGISFSVIRTPDNICRGKPSPDHLLLAMALTNTDPVNTIYIGDMDVDYLAAKSAGVDYIHAMWGYSPTIKHDVLKLNSFMDIFTYLERK